MSADPLRCPSIWSVSWFRSRTVRQATQMCKHVRKLVNAQRDLLDPRAISAIADAVADLGSPEEIARVFVTFQQYLYQQAA